jgi:hypothetical protein
MHLGFRIHKVFHEIARVLYAHYTSTSLISPPAQYISFHGSVNISESIPSIVMTSGRKHSGLIKISSRNLPGETEVKSENLSDDSRRSGRDSSASLKRCHYAHLLGQNKIVWIKYLVSSPTFHDLSRNRYSGHSYLSSTHVLLRVSTTRYSSHRYLVCAPILRHLFRNRYSDNRFFVSGFTFLHLSATRYSAT